MPNLSSPFHLFLNPSQIQIRTQFTWVPVYYRYWAHVPSFLPIFFLSPPEASLLLSLAFSHYRAHTPLPSSPITEPHILITHFPKQTKNYNITSIQINEPSKMISQILFHFTKYFLKKTKTTAIHPFVKIVVQNFVYTLKNKLLFHKDLNFK